MQTIVSNLTGFVHLITAILALIAGTYILLTAKGTSRHRKVGYVYVFSMSIMLLTSFLIYRLFSGFGLFHGFSILSTVTLIGGMLPVIRRKSDNWVVRHFAWMYWSVMGLYTAFVAEVITRMPETPFYGMLGVAIFIVMGSGAFFWKKNKPKWERQFAVYKKKKNKVK